MSQIKKTSYLLCILFLFSVFSLTGCGSSNSEATFDSDKGEHPAGWLPEGHVTEAKASLESCTPCHGADYAGGISKIACTVCHIGNQQSIHPATWGPFGYILHADYVGENGNSSCANALCHGVNLNGGDTGPSCTFCHMGGIGAIHPANWANNTYIMHAGYAEANGTAACANARCHGTNLDGVGGTGPSCTSCHIGDNTSVHPSNWGSLAYALHGSYVNVNTNASCANAACHGASLAGVSGSGPSCTLCHMGGVGEIHPANWANNAYILHAGYVKTNGTAACANAKCHGADLKGVEQSGPSCDSCH